MDRKKKAVSGAAGASSRDRQRKKNASFTSNQRAQKARNIRFSPTTKKSAPKKKKKK
jgi:hypothetical protein